MLLSFLGVAACVAVGGAPAGATAAHARPKLLSGKTKIRKLELLKLTGGSHRGALLVWADVVHGRVTSAAKASRKTSNVGRLRVELRGSRGSSSGSAHFRLPVSGPPQASRPENGYRVMIPRRQAKRLGSGPIELLARASQRLDLDGDGEADASGADIQRERRRPASVAQTFPKPGNWAYSDTTTAYVFTTDSASVTLFSGFSRTETCMFQDPMHSPVDPQTGYFQHYDGTVDASGQFNAGNTSATVTGDFALGACYVDFVHEGSFTPAQ